MSRINLLVQGSVNDIQDRSVERFSLETFSLNDRKHSECQFKDAVINIYYYMLSELRGGGGGGGGGGVPISIPFTPGYCHFL